MILTLHTPYGSRYSIETHQVHKDNDGTNVFGGDNDPVYIIDGYPRNGGPIMVANDCRQFPAYYKFNDEDVLLKADDEARINCAWVNVLYFGWPLIVTVATKEIDPRSEIFVKCVHLSRTMLCLFTHLLGLIYVPGVCPCARKKGG